MKQMTSYRYFFSFLFTIIITIESIAQVTTIPLQTEHHAIVLQTDKDNRLRMIYSGKPLQNNTEYNSIAKAYHLNDNDAGIYNAAYTPAGTWNLSIPAIEVLHSDGNPSLELKYVNHHSEATNDGAALTKIVLKDPVYPFTVTLCYKVWNDDEVIQQWSEIEHNEKGAVVLQKYASANLYFANKDFYLTTFQGQYAKEMQPAETKLVQGIRSIESTLGTRAMLLQSPNFILSYGKAAQENEGSVMLGQLSWTGNFKLDFEIDSYQNLRLLAGIHPYNSAYTLQPNKVFVTPPFTYTFSDSGTGTASRHLQSWVRKHKLVNGDGERLTLLNNWEATYFNFDENKLTSLFADAKTLGVDLFLLDDGWFGNKYPRDDDHAGLGDWQENKKKLPHGIGYLVKEATAHGIKFGIWIEPEMVNPKSELYEKHLDWVIRQPGRPEIYYRNQLVLDLSNPAVQDFVYGIVDSLFTKNPSLAFIKWDCNAVIYNAYSSYLNKNKLPQSHLYVEYVKGLYNVLKRLRSKYPSVPMMLCSGGGGRSDYEMLKYFTEFWPSDDTDPLERIYQQYDYSYFFPSIAVDCHVTNSGRQPIKFKVDVASMGKLGFDIIVNKLSDNDKQFCTEAVHNYNGFKDIVWHGDMYRLANPHEGDIASLVYVKKDKTKAVMFTYLSNNRVGVETRLPIVLKGLDAAKQYRITEINLYPGTTSTLTQGQVLSGDYLMTIGYNPDVNSGRSSVVLQIEAVK